MADHAVTPQLASRIGLAANALPQSGIGHLTALLVDMVGLPLTLSKLASLEPEDLQRRLGGGVDGASLERATACLRGENVPNQRQPKMYTQGDLSGSVRVACASNNGERLDGHFGSCARFLVYQVCAQEIRLIDVRPADNAQADREKNTYRSELIQDCDLLYVISIGGPAAARVVKAGVLPIKQPSETDTREVLIPLQHRIATDPPPWLAKAMGLNSKDPARLKNMIDTPSVENER